MSAAELIEECLHVDENFVDSGNFEILVEEFGEVEELEAALSGFREDRFAVTEKLTVDVFCGGHTVHTFVVL